MSHGINGEVVLAGDKSVTHRAMILAALGHGISELRNPSRGLDAEATKNVLRTLGAHIEPIPGGVAVDGSRFPVPGNYDLDCKNSGTTMRLITGVIAGMPGISAVLRGDASLMNRPMDRVAEPLTQMGALVSTEEGRPPVRVWGDHLHGAAIRAKIPSAQVKSAVLLAALSAHGTTGYTEYKTTRDHTERMFRWLGLPIQINGPVIEVHGPANPPVFDFTVPGDVSNAAVLTALALSVPGSDLILPGVLCNPSRNGFFERLNEMGAGIRMQRHLGECEDTCDIAVRTVSELADFDVSAPQVVDMIDEVPLFCVVAALHGASGRLHGVAELRVKESDRVRAVIDLLAQINIRARVEDDTLVIEHGMPKALGPIAYHGRDHRLAAASLVLAMGMGLAWECDYPDVMDVSFPGLLDLVEATNA